MPKVLSILSTYQTPHFEDLVHMAKILNDDSIVEVLDVADNAPLRVDLPINDNLRTSASKIFHNFFKKRFAKKYFIIAKKTKIITFKINSSEVVSQNIFNWHDVLNAYLSYWYVKKNTLGMELNTDQLCKFYQLSVYAGQIIKFIQENYSLEDRIIIFNARLPLEYFIHKGLEQAGFQNIQFLELSQYNQKILLRNDPPHDLKSFHNEITELVKSESPTFIEEEFRKLTTSLRTDYIPVHTKDQNTVVIFTSSLDEFFFKFDHVPNILHIISILIENLKSLGYNVVVRIHPITHTKTIESKIPWLVLKYKYPDNVILWNEPADSFDIIHKSAGVITFGSSLSSYAAAVGKPVLVLGDNTLYSKLSAVKNITFEDSFYHENTKLRNLKNIFNGQSNSTSFELIEAKAAFIFERYLGCKRTHSLLGRNIERNVTIFKHSHMDASLSTKDYRLFTGFLKIYKRMLSVIKKRESIIAQNVDQYFFIEFSEDGKFDIVFTSVPEDWMVPFDSCRNCIENCSDSQGDILDFRSVPLEFFSVKPNDLLTLAYESWSFPKRCFHKVGFYEAFFYWKKKYQIELDESR